MLFNSALYLFAFLPIALFIYYVLFRNVSLKSRNFLLIVISVVFFFLADPFLGAVLLLLTAVNRIWMLRLQGFGGRGRLAAFITVNALLWVAYYLIPPVLAFFDLPCFFKSVPLVGLIFFCHTLEMLLLAYRNDKSLQAAGSTAVLFFLFYPVSTAGPLLQFPAFARQAEDREIGRIPFSEGAKEFVYGLSKVIILGRILSYAPRTAFQAVPDISVSFAVLALISFFFQLYYELSGFCQMARGTALMFGFRLPKNFEFLTRSDTFTAFFNGSNRSVAAYVTDILMPERTGSIFSAVASTLAAAVIFTGFFGFSQNTIFVVLFLAACLLLEQAFLHRFTTGNRVINYVLHFVALCPTLAVTLVLLGSKNPTDATSFFSLLLGFTSGVENVTSGSMFLREYWFFYLMAALCALPVAPFFSRLGEKKFGRLFQAAETLWLILLLIACTGFFTLGTYLPFFAA